MLQQFKSLIKKTNAMSGISLYANELSPIDILQNKHRGFIGGKWEEIGQLQYDFMRSQGLQPQHKLLDIGCGCLRGGIHFIDYLESGNYYGLDVNASLIKAAWHEVKVAKLNAKNPQLLVSDRFEIDKFATKFDYMLSISVFTHLPMNIIIRCLSEVSKNLTPEGKYYSTCFIAPTSAYTKTIKQAEEVLSQYDRDPFHYSLEEITFMAKVANLQVRLVEEWHHPRNQQMLEFSAIEE
ncbi:MAG: class I SAM-dependent methyltransferase [Cyanobacteria bacterium J06623_7]